MYPGNHVTHPIGQHNQVDARAPTNPQPIPRNTRLPPRGTFPTTARSYPSYSPAQSPQQPAGQYITPQGSVNDMSRSHVAVTPSGPAKTHAAGTPGHMFYPAQPVGPYPQQQMPNAYGMPPKYPHNQHANPSNQFVHTVPTTTPHMPPPPPSLMASNNPHYMRFMAAQVPFVSQPPQSTVVHSGARPSIASPPYYQHIYPTPVQPQMPFAGYDSMQQYASPASHPAPPAPPPQVTPNPRSSRIVIKDPNTLEDVTNNVLSSGRQSESSPSPSATQNSSATPAAAQTKPAQAKIAAQFAARVAVAAAATSNSSQPAKNQASVSQPPTQKPSVQSSAAGPVNADMQKDLPAKATEGGQVSSEPSVGLNDQSKAAKLVQDSSPHPKTVNGSTAEVLPNTVSGGVDSVVNKTPREDKEVGKVHENQNNIGEVNAPVAAKTQQSVDKPIPLVQEESNSETAAAPISKEKKNVIEAPTIPASAKNVNGTNPPSTTAKEQSLPDTVETGKKQGNLATDSPSIATDVTTSTAVTPTSGAALPTKTDAPVVNDNGQATAVKEFQKIETPSTPQTAETVEKPKTAAPAAISHVSVPKQDKPVVQPVNSDMKQASAEVKKDVPLQDNKKTSDKLIEDVLDEDNDDKKVYDRSFLMQFQFHNTSMEKPRGLPKIEDIIMDRPLPKSAISNSMTSVGDGGMYRGGGSTDFTPKYMTGAPGGHGRSSSRGPRPGGQQRYGGGYPHQHPGPRGGKVISIQREPQLQRTENAWKPSKADAVAASSDVPEEERETEEIMKKVRSILNKLTPQKFQQLMVKLQSLQINSEARLRGVIDLIFEKAIDEPNFCEAYANMCRTMSQFRVTTPAANQGGAQNATTVEFRKILLTRCQREFEKDRANEEALSKLRQSLDEATTPEERQQRKEILDVNEAKERRRMLGNIRFIGELFKLSMLTESIMHNCIMSLFKARDEDSLESLCRLLTTIGKDLDHEKGQQRMTQYFQQMEKIICEKKTSSRVRFMLKDVVDLRKCRWVPRASKAQGPKTIEQIHADAKEEKEKIALQAAANAAAAANAPMKNQRGGRGGSRGHGGGHAGGDEGWTKVPQKPIRYDPNKMKLSKTSFDESKVTLGPTRGKSGWKSGSGSSATKTGSGSYVPTRDNVDGGNASRSSTPTTMNRFSALTTPAGPDTSPFNQRRASSRQSSREGTRSGSRGSGGHVPQIMSRDEKQASIDAARRLTSQDKKSRSTEAVIVHEMDPAKMKSKCKGILKEYMHLVSVKEASECYVELAAPANLAHIFVWEAMQGSLEKKSSDRQNIANLLVDFLRSDKISVEQYIKGVVPVVGEAVELELDLPKIWSCLAEQLVPVFISAGTGVDITHLPKFVGNLLEEDKADVFVAEILKGMTGALESDAVLGLWKNSGLCWSMFGLSDSTRRSAFLERHKLQNFDTEEAAKDEDHSNKMVSNIRKQLDVAVANADEHFDWIERNLDQQQRTSDDFVRALVVAVCQKAIIQGEQNMEVNRELIKNHSLLLKKYIDNGEKELQAVFALQKLYLELEQPPNILKLLFDYLYDEDIISEQTFFKWEKSDDPAEGEGKGVALLSVHPFFTWLRDADPESDE